MRTANLTPDQKVELAALAGMTANQRDTRKELRMTSRDDNRRLAEAYAEAMGIGADDPQTHDDMADDPDNFTHDYAACQDLSCVRCDAYGDGYSAGKETAYFEVRNWHPQQHAPSCGCNPCIAARSVMSKVR